MFIFVYLIDRLLGITVGRNGVRNSRRVVFVVRRLAKVDLAMLGMGPFWPPKVSLWGTIWLFDDEKKK